MAKTFLFILPLTPFSSSSGAIAIETLSSKSEITLTAGYDLSSESAVNGSSELTSSASQASSAATSDSVKLTVAKSELQLDNAISTFSLSGNIGNPASIIYSTTNSNSCQIFSNYLVATTAGTCTLSAQLIYTSYGAARVVTTNSVVVTVTSPANLISGTPKFSIYSDARLTLVHRTLQLSPNGLSIAPDAVTYILTANNAGCTINGDILSVTDIGNCNVIAVASKAGYAQFYGRPNIFNVYYADFASHLVVSASRIRITLDDPTTVLSATESPTADSHEYSFTTNTANCQIVGNVLTAANAGRCNVWVRAFKYGYNSLPSLRTVEIEVAAAPNPEVPTVVSSAPAAESAASAEVAPAVQVVPVVPVVPAALFTASTPVAKVISSNSTVTNYGNNEVTNPTIAPQTNLEVKNPVTLVKSSEVTVEPIVINANNINALVPTPALLAEIASSVKATGRAILVYPNLSSSLSLSNVYRILKSSNKYKSINIVTFSKATIPACKAAKGACYGISIVK